MSECVTHGGRPGTYAQRGAAKKYLHRLVWEERHGTIPDGHVIHHECGTKDCVNVEHLVCMPHGEHTVLHKISRTGRQTVCRRCGGTDMRIEKNCNRCRDCERPRLHLRYLRRRAQGK